MEKASFKPPEIGIINPYQQDKGCIIQIIVSYLTTPLERVRGFIPEVKGLRSSHCLKCLLVISVNDNISITGVAKLFNSPQKGTSRNIKYLAELGLVIGVNKPYYVGCFNRYRMDTGYFITAKGRRVLAELLD